MGSWWWKRVEPKFSLKKQNKTKQKRTGISKYEKGAVPWAEPSNQESNL